MAFGTAAISPAGKARYKAFCSDRLTMFQRNDRPLICCCVMAPSTGVTMGVSIRECSDPDIIADLRCFPVRRTFTENAHNLLHHPVNLNISPEVAESGTQQQHNQVLPPINRHSSFTQLYTIRVTLKIRTYSSEELVSFYS